MPRLIVNTSDDIDEKIKKFCKFYRLKKNHAANIALARFFRKKGRF